MERCFCKISILLRTCIKDKTVIVDAIAIWKAIRVRVACVGEKIRKQACFVATVHMSRELAIY